MSHFKGDLPPYKSSIISTPIFFKVLVEEIFICSCFPTVILRTNRGWWWVSVPFSQSRTLTCSLCLWSVARIRCVRLDDKQTNCVEQTPNAVLHSLQLSCRSIVHFSCSNNISAVERKTTARYLRAGFGCSCSCSTYLWAVGKTTKPVPNAAVDSNGRTFDNFID